MTAHLIRIHRVKLSPHNTGRRFPHSIINRICSIFIVSGLLLFTALHTPVRAGEIIRIGGTGTGLGAMKLLGEAFEKIHPDVKVQIVPDLGGAGGVLALLQGAIELSVSGSAVNHDERVSGVSAVEYARTPFVFVVNKGVIKNGLTLGELENIYNGKIQKWPGGKPVRTVLRPIIDTDTRIISSISPGMAQALKAARARKGHIVAVTDRESIEAIASTPGAIGTSTLTQIATEKLPLKVLTFDGAVPNLTSLASGSYRLFKPLFLVTTSRTPPAARQFADFVRSPHGAIILTQSGNLVIEAPATK